MRPDLVKLLDFPFDKDDLFDRYQQEKLHAFASEPSSCAISDSADLEKIRMSLETLFSQPILADVALEGKQLALTVQEDLVLMHRDTLEAAWVCFPSGWNPGEKIGKSFVEIHQPVPGIDPISSRAPNLTRAMIQGRFSRYVWGIKDNPNLSQHPSLNLDKTPELYFRAERQVSVGIPELERFWFLIRIYHVPLEQVLTTLERCTLLAKSVETMPNDLLEYKNMSHLKARILSQIEKTTQELGG